MTSKWLQWGRKVGYPFSTIARRIKKKVRESFSYLFVLAIAGIISVLGVVFQPLFASPISWSNISLYNLEVVLSRLLYVWVIPLIALFVGTAIWLNREIKKIDEAKNERLADKLTEKLTDSLKTVLKEVLKEDREVKKDFGKINKELKLRLSEIKKVNKNEPSHKENQKTA